MGHAGTLDVLAVQASSSLMPEAVLETADRNFPVWNSKP